MKTAIARSVGILLTTVSAIFAVSAKAALVGSELDFTVVSGSTTPGGKTVDASNPFIGTFTLDTDSLSQPITVIPQNGFSMVFTAGGVDFNATNTLGTIEVRKNFGTGPNDITCLEDGIATLDSDPIPSSIRGRTS